MTDRRRIDPETGEVRADSDAADSPSDVDPGQAQDTADGDVTVDPDATGHVVEDRTTDQRVFQLRHGEIEDEILPPGERDDVAALLDAVECRPQEALEIAMADRHERGFVEGEGFSARVEFRVDRPACRKCRANGDLVVRAQFNREFLDHFRYAHTRDDFIRMRVK